MRAARQSTLTTRRNFLHHGVSLAGAATLPAGTAATSPNAAVHLAQAGALGAAASAITVKSTRLVGSAINYAYAVKAGPWVFLNGHEAFDFERGRAGGGRAARQPSGRPASAAARGRLPAAPYARSSQGIWHRSAERGAGRPVLHYGGGG